MSMYCYQCEQTAKGGCATIGVCGKDADSAALQDLLIEMTKGIALYARAAAQQGVHDKEVDKFVLEALFTTVTNVNFDAERLSQLVDQAFTIREKAKQNYQNACQTNNATPKNFTGAATMVPAATVAEKVAQGAAVAITKKFALEGEVVTGLKELIIYGLKGAAAYADHALILGYWNETLASRFNDVLAFLTENHSVEELTGKALEVGEINMQVMELLDQANTTTYGHPEPTQVRVTPVKGKAILVSGHDLKDLEELLKQTSGKGVNVYTHGEMLPTLAYPALKKYAHLVGNYGGAWQDQHKEFAAFPGSILMTTNCIQKPQDSYKDRIFTCGLVAWPGVKHIADRNFQPVIDAALAAPGFTADEPAKYITVGFGRNAVLGVADKVIDAVKAGAIRRFFLIGGCDGAKSGRNYYTELAQQVPADCVILTLACGKFRFNKLEFGDIGGIPRLLDIGQCNDAYSAVQIAVALANAFETDVNSLPLSMVLSWYEQKAVAILLTLLYLGIKNIRIGPSLPAFITPPVLQVLSDGFNLMPITTPEQDLAAILG